MLARKLDSFLDSFYENELRFGSITKDICQPPYSAFPEWK